MMSIRLKKILKKLTVGSTVCLLCSSASANLLINGGNDEALVGGEIAGWTEVVGDTWTQRSASPSPQDGAAYFNPGAGASHELAQIVDVSAYATDIDAGTQQFDFSGFVNGYSKEARSDSDADTAQIILEFQDESGAVLATWESVTDSYNYYNDGWVQLTHSRLAPANTRKIKVRLLAERFDGTNNDGYFDSLELTTRVISEPGTVIEFNGMSGSNNDPVPSGFGSNLSSSIPGATVMGDGTPDIALAWAGGGTGGWDLHGGSGATWWAALDSNTATTPSVVQMEPGSPQCYIDFTVVDGCQLILNSVDIGMSTGETGTSSFTITIAEVGGAVVATYTPPAMDGDGSSGVQAQTVNLDFTGNPGVDYRLQFVDSPDTNGGAIDNLFFSEIPDSIAPSLSASDSLSPEAGSTNVSINSALVLNFSESVQVGTGNMVIRRTSDDGVVDTIDVTGVNVTIYDQQVWISPSVALPAETSLYVEVAAGAFEDLSGNPFAGISGSAIWSFTTGPIFRLTMVSNGTDLDFGWPSQSNTVYDLLSSTNLLIPLDSWLPYDPAGNDPFTNILSGGAITTLTAVPIVDSRRYFASEEKKNTVRVTFLHVNDSHGIGVTVTDGMSRLAQVATIVKQVKKVRGIDRVIVTNGGDIGVRPHDDDYLSNTTYGKAEVIALNSIGFDVMTSGNHEADRGLDWLQEVMALSEFPWLGANVYYAGTTNYIMSGGSHVVFDVHGAKITIMGLCPVRGTWTILKPDPAAIDGRDEITVGAELAPILRPQSDLLVALTHIGDDDDPVLAAQDIDLIMGGHSHSEIEGEMVDGTLIVQSRYHHEFVARVDVTLSNSSGTWEVTQMSSQLLPTADFTPDVETVALLMELEDFVKAGGDLNDYPAP
jgi:hypothetical protein